MLRTNTTILQTTVTMFKYHCRLYKVNRGLIRSLSPVHVATFPRPFNKQHIGLPSALFCPITLSLLSPTLQQWGPGVKVKVLRYKSGGSGINSRWCHWGNFPWYPRQNHVPWVRLSLWKYQGFILG